VAGIPRVLVILVALCAGGAAARTAAPAASPQQVGLARADASYAALSRYLVSHQSAVQDTGVYAWPLSQAVYATLQISAFHPTAAYRAAAASSLDSLARYWQPGRIGGYASSAVPPFGPGGAQYYDDNEWIASDLLEAYNLGLSSEALGRVRVLFRLVISGWAASATPCVGGVYWVRGTDNHDRNAVTTENGALLGVELYFLTGRHDYLRWARRMFAWSDQCLGRSDGLLADHLAADGTRDERAWSYNQGARVAAAVLLARATGDQSYLDSAERTATTALEMYGTFEGEPRIFVAIFFRDVALLDAVRPQPAYRQALAAYGDQAWKVGRDPSTGLFTASDGPSLLDQAAMVQIYGLLAGGRGSTFQSS
jgi:hypothetical protein